MTAKNIFILSKILQIHKKITEQIQKPNILFLWHLDENQPKWPLDGIHLKKEMFSKRAAQLL